MNIIDSSAWIAYFEGDSNARTFAVPIKQQSKLIVPTIILTETYKYFLREVDKKMAVKLLAQMRQGNIADLDEGIAIDAAHLGQKHKLAIADSIIYATAQRYGATLWTQDKHFQDLDNVQYFAKNDIH